MNHYVQMVFRMDMLRRLKISSVLAPEGPPFFQFYDCACSNYKGEANWTKTNLQEYITRNHNNNTFVSRFFFHFFRWYVSFKNTFIAPRTHVPVWVETWNTFHDLYSYSCTSHMWRSIEYSDVSFKRTPSSIQWNDTNTASRYPFAIECIASIDAEKQSVRMWVHETLGHVFPLFIGVSAVRTPASHRSWNDLINLCNKMLESWRKK